MLRIQSAHPSKTASVVIWLLLALLAAAVVKIWLIASGVVPFHADEAVVALMARHILQGARPVFFYGQAYMGSLDAWLVAGGFALLGQHVWVIRLVQAILYVLTVVTTAWLGKTALNSWPAGVAAAWLLAVPAVNVSLYTTASLGGYGEALVIGNLVLISGFRIGSHLKRGIQAPGWLWWTWGFLAGLGLWTFGLTLVYILPVSGYLAWRVGIHLRRAGTGREDRVDAGPARLLGGFRLHRLWLSIGLPAVLAGVGVLAGSVPWWGYARQHGLSQLLGELGGGAIAGVEGLSGLGQVGQHAVNLLLLGIPVIFGLRPPWEVRWLGLPLLPLILMFWIAGLAFFVRRLSSDASHRAERMALAGTAVFLLAGFLFTPFGADPSGRYFLPLAILLALSAAEMVLTLRKPLGAWAWGLVCLVLIYHLWGTVQCARRNPPGLTTQFYSAAQVDTGEIQVLIEFLRQQGETRGYTNYWVAYPLAFLSQEEILFVPRLPYHLDFRYTSRDDRYPAYTRLVGQARRTAYITTRNPALDAYLRNEFKAQGLQWEEAWIGDYHVFYHLSRQLALEELGLGVSRP